MSSKIFEGLDSFVGIVDSIEDLLAGTVEATERTKFGWIAANDTYKEIVEAGRDGKFTVGDAFTCLNTLLQEFDSDIKVNDEVFAKYKDIVVASVERSENPKRRNTREADQLIDLALNGEANKRIMPRQDTCTLTKIWEKHKDSGKWTVQSTGPSCAFNKRRRADDR
ncbi:MAG: hypothetical protein N0E59_02140 [Candidatus Thiodiazotropha taylori]|nr:hypothetical protein [Candidatus Thiodiazotropha taylori]MCG8051906.1 hypothetical protein [Candidatus Thiodiazotropha taylori]MCG8108678.1 hypothetical protein [Candidatus Thiodiazotropha taylori]MCG8109542.1 hypothetical protein [Candidatus Thiodiazotropha taylori]MCW4281014.1 hypothetical protein [Candidatus Thiodiazotropha taylori]